MFAEIDDLALALRLADLADALTLARFLDENLAVETKPDLTPVTEVDRAVERAVRDELALARPEDSVVGEEYGAASASEGARRWIVDPIDGTKNYVRGIPAWGTLMALDDGRELVVGVVSAPALGRRWWARRGEGAYVRDGMAAGDARRIRVSGVRALDAAQLSFAGLEDWAEIDRLDPVLELTRRCWRTRSFGDFWAYMLVAEGAMDIALDPVVSVWDLAAPQVIVEEAGGAFTDLAGERRPDGGDAIATNGLLHDAALQIIGR